MKGKAAPAPRAKSTPNSRKYWAKVPALPLLGFNPIYLDLTF